MVGGKWSKRIVIGRGKVTERYLPTSTNARILHQLDLLHDCLLTHYFQISIHFHPNISDHTTDAVLKVLVMFYVKYFNRR
jgi:hypothetical protein